MPQPKGAVPGTCYGCKKEIPKSRRWRCDVCRQLLRHERYFTVRPVKNIKDK